MKNILSIMFLFALLASSCSEDELAKNQTVNSLKFTASFEEDESRTYVEEGNLLRWTAGDQISLFVANTLNQQYQFEGKTGANSGYFNRIGNSFGTGNDLSHHYAVYPYASDIEITENGVITATLPSKQSYAENSFGLGANTMVAVTKNTDDTYLKFKNVGGYLKLQLYGDDVTIKSITLTGNNGEKLAGKTNITSIYGQDPIINMAEDATKIIILDCGKGVKIGTTAKMATAFWIVVPPTKFERGLKVTITDIKSGTYTKATSNEISIERNLIKPMEAFKVEEDVHSDVNNFTITTAEASSLTPLSVSLSAEYNGFDEIIGKAWKFGVCYGTSNNPNITDAVQYASGTSDGTYSYDIDIEPNMTYYYRSVAYYDGAYYYGEVKSFTSPNLATDFQAVDLGLSVKWASSNLGASTADESGDYYAWGETSTKSEYTLDNYVYYDSQMDAYINLGSNISKTSYDAAYVQLGGKWRMPTYQEVSELVTSCTWHEAFYKGHAGYLVKGSNDNYIFVKTVSCTHTSSSKMKYSQFWSSTLSNEYNDLNTNNYAHYLNYSYFGVENTYMARSSFRYYGLPIRPVCDY